MHVRRNCSLGAALAGVLVAAVPAAAQPDRNPAVAAPQASPPPGMEDRPCDPPAIVADAEDVAVCIGGSAALTVVVDGTAPLAYQWRRNDVALPGETAPTLTLEMVTPADAGDYDVMVSNECGSTISLAARVTVVASPPTIIEQPVGAAVCDGVSLSAVLEVVASGGELSYQWRRDGEDMTGENASTLTIDPITPGDADSYDVVVSNPCDSVTSAAVRVDYNTVPVIEQPPAAQSVCAGEAIELLVVASGGDGPVFADELGSTDLSGTGSRIRGNVYAVTSQTVLTRIEQFLTMQDVGAVTFFVYEAQVEAGPYALVHASIVDDLGPGGGFFASGPLNVTLKAGRFYIVGAAWPGGHAYYWDNAAPPIATAFGALRGGYAASYFDPLPANPLAVGTRNALSYYQRLTTRPVPLAYQWRKDGEPIGGAAGPVFTIEPAVVDDAGDYDVLVSGSCGSVTSAVVTVAISEAPLITVQPLDQAVCLGQPATFTVQTDGTATSFQWRKDAVDIAGATDVSYTIPAASALDAGTYDVVVAGDCGTVTSDPATLSVGDVPPQIVEQPAGGSVCEGQLYTFQVIATGSGLAYQWRRNDAEIDGATGATYVIDAASTGNAGDYDVVVSSGCGVVTSTAVTLIVGAAQNITQQPQGLTVCAGEPATFSVAAAGSSITYQWRKSGVNINGATAAVYTIAATTPTDAGVYDVVVTSTCGTAVSDPAVLAVDDAMPAFTQQPQSGVGCAGSPWTLSVVVPQTGVSYQWRKGGADIVGADEADYTIAALTAQDAGDYDVVATNGCGTATSATATLTIGTPVSITQQPAGGGACTGESFVFVVLANGTPPLSYRWRRNGADIPGATTNTYTLDAVTTDDSGAYDALVTNACGSVASQTATLNVGDGAVEIVGQPADVAGCEGESVTLSVTVAGDEGTAHTVGTTASSSTGPRLRGNYYAVSATTTLTRIEHYLDITIPSPLVFFVYEAATSGGPYSLVAQDTVADPGTGAGFYASNALDIALEGGKYYIIGTGWSGSQRYYWGGSHPQTVSFGTTQSGFAAGYLNPLPATAPQNTSSLVFHQRLTTSDAGFVYQWRQDGADIPGADAPAYTIESATPADAGLYDVVVDSGCDAVVSDAALLTVENAPQIIEQPQSRIVSEGSAVTFSVGVAGDDVLSSTDTVGDTTSQGSGARIRGNAYRVDLNTRLTRIEQYLSITASGPITFFVYEAIDADGPYTLILEDTVADPGTGAGFFASNPLDLSLAAGRYYIVGAAWPGPHGYYWGGEHPQPTVFGETVAGYSQTYQMPLETDPVATSELVYNQRLTTESSPFAYQWRHDGVDIAGATGPSHTIAAVAPQDAGTYEVQVASGCGLIVSDPALLALRPAPSGSDATGPFDPAGLDRRDPP